MKTKRKFEFRLREKGKKTEDFLHGPKSWVETFNNKQIQHIKLFIAFSTSLSRAFQPIPYFLPIIFKLYFIYLVKNNFFNRNFKFYNKDIASSF